MVPYEIDPEVTANDILCFLHNTIVMTKETMTADEFEAFASGVQSLASAYLSIKADVYEEQSGEV